MSVKAPGSIMHRPAAMHTSRSTMFSLRSMKPMRPAPSRNIPQKEVMVIRTTSKAVYSPMNSMMGLNTKM